MYTSFFCGVILLAVYVAVYIAKHKTIPYSLSDTYFSLKHTVLFSVLMVGLAFLTAPALIETMPSERSFLGFLVAAGLLFVGAAPNFKGGMQKWIHIAGTAITGIASVFYVIEICAWLHLVWIPYAVYLAVMFIRNRKKGLSIYDAFLECKPLFLVEMIIFALLTAATIVA